MRSVSDETSYILLDNSHIKVVIYSLQTDLDMDAQLVQM